MRAVLALAVLTAACTAPDEGSSTSAPVEAVPTHRYISPEDRYALDAPDEWTISRDRGATVFTAPRGKKHSIVVSTAPKPIQLVEGRETSAEDVAAATERVLKTLPRASIERRWTIRGAATPAQAFALEFTPPGLNRRYQRVHVVVVGAERLFHLTYTAPANEQISDAALQQMVVGLQEEV